MKNQIEFCDPIVKFRLFLHRYIYSDQMCLNILFDYMKSNFDLFNLSYDPVNRIIDLKIKKTNIKKSPNYNHSVDYYYPIINNIMSQFINNDYVHGMITNTLSEAKDTDFDYNEIKNILNSIAQSNNIQISLLYHLCLVLDNSITIQL